jgi:hypothetical protein
VKQVVISSILALAACSLPFGIGREIRQEKVPARPDFSGTWKLNIEKSNFGPIPAPKSRVDKIQHKDPSLQFTSTRVTEEGEETVTLTLTTDGKENTNSVRGTEVKSTGKWEGAALVIDSKANIGGNELSIKDKFTLSEDGKTLTVARHYAGPEGEADATTVLERQ